MCLACELDALWYAEWEQLAAEGAGAAGAADPGTAGVPPALPGQAGAESVEAEGAVETFAPPSSLSGSETGGALAEVFAEAKRAGGTPAVSGSPARPAAPRSGFLCEETE
jgi:hypothetical protein